MKEFEISNKPKLGSIDFDFKNHLDRTVRFIRNNSQFEV